jgi:hypothetical protein
MNRLLTPFLATIALLGTCPCAHADWAVKDVSGNLHLFSEFPIDPQTVQRQFQEIKAQLSQHLGLDVGDTRVEVILFASSRGYRSYLAGKLTESSRRRAIFYRNNDVLQVYAYRNRYLNQDLRHELTHALLHSTLPYIPLWIDEGLAEYFEEPASDRKSSARMASVRWKSRLGWTPDLRQLEQITSAASMSADDYRDSWAYVEFLLNSSPESRQLFAKYLQAISAGEAPGNFSEWAPIRQTLAPGRISSYFRRFQNPLR